MVDPYAPPQESASRPTRPAPYAEPYQPPSSGSQAYSRTYEQSYEPAPVHDAPRDRDRPWRRAEGHEPHTDPARPGLFWTVAAVGIGLLLLARLTLFFVVQDALPDGRVAPALFATLGLIALSAGLCLAGLLQRGLATPWRVALLLGAGYFAVVGGAGPPFGLAGLL